MKRLLPIVLLLCLFFEPISAQKKDFKPELYIGVGGGALMSSVDFAPAVLQKNQLGIHGGISARYISEKNLGLQFELNYAQRGWTEDFSSTPEFAYSRTLHYLEIPLMTHIYFGRKLRFVINAGPQLGFLLGGSAQMSEALAKDVADRQQQNPTQKIGAQYSAEPRKFDYGLLGGVGMELHTGIGNFEVEGRYYFGLGDIFNNKRAVTGLTRSAHRIIEAKVSYFFKLK